MQEVQDSLPNPRRERNEVQDLQVREDRRLSSSCAAQGRPRARPRDHDEDRRETSGAEGEGVMDRKTVGEGVLYSGGSVVV